MFDLNNNTTSIEMTTSFCQEVSSLLPNQSQDHLVESNITYNNIEYEKNDIELSGATADH